MHWLLKKFDALSPTELYAILQLRSEVFVVEQNCVYQDMDGKDLKSLHLQGFSQHTLVACSRLLPPGVSYSQASIGRVAVKKTARNKGIGKLLMQQSICQLHEVWGRQPITIGAQLYLNNFYQSLGFVPRGPVYHEEGIPHIEMILAV